MSRIFVSHSSRHASSVIDLIRRIENASPENTFFLSSRREDLPSGSDWWATVSSELTSADKVVFCMGADDAPSSRQLFELGHAVGSGVDILVIGLGAVNVSKLPSPLSHFQIELLPENPESAARRMCELVSVARPIASLESPILQLGKKRFPLDQGWEAYTGSNAHPAKTALGVSFGSSFDNGFRTPNDELNAPWQFLAFQSARDADLHLYFVLELNNRKRIKIYASTNLRTWGYSGDPSDEFRVPVSSAMLERPHCILVRSLEKRLGGKPRKLIGLRVRGPTELHYIGAAKQMRDLAVREEMIELALPGGR